ncbi:MAG: hypothetical protein WCK98_04335 [bacterium]
MLKSTKLIALRIPIELYDLIAKKAKQDQRSVSNFIKKTLMQQLDETEYLLSTEANKKSMYRGLEQVKNGEVVGFKNMNDVITQVKNITNKGEK